MVIPRQENMDFVVKPSRFRLNRHCEFSIVRLGWRLGRHRRQNIESPCALLSSPGKSFSHESTVI